MRVKHSEGVWRKRWTLLPSLADSGIGTLISYAHMDTLFPIA